MSVPDGDPVLDDPVLSPDMANERLAAWRGRIERLASDTKAMNEQFQQVSVTVEDAGGLCRVTVDSAGAMTDLWLSSRVQRVQPEALARTIMKTVTEARRELGRRAQQIITETMGDSAAGQAIAARVADRLRVNAEQSEPTDDPGWG